MKNTKKTAKHTAGEWEVFTGKERHEIELLIRNKEGRKIAYCGNKQLAEARANARLIASAPLMLKALEAVLNMGDDYEAEKLVRKAIKTAKGE